MQYYICDACKFQFVNTCKPDRCPDCGKKAIREASFREIEEFKRIQEELKEEDS